ncbi:EVE domain-containing protein [Lichenihabitans sp. Uapishka_5]|uniref:EVE domain-containing protein n=1 Tax=Lichenihabitans sp. Uapishka_5 TaxID=3037302 RepID=UPI0029E80FBA|nr:EVE domain-containing protein [Lichenihabitans sp. Uapishka_5]MDX7953155.1 EVE domain-containing protein [Lichenihabitans sp. Uapishka_5]
MAKWLVKSEPSSWSFTQQIEAGPKGTHWNGVRNHVAKQHLMAMQMGEEAFFYHSNHGKEIVGIVAVSRTYYPDPTDASGKFGMVDFTVVRALARPVSLEEIKRTSALGDMVLVRNSRMSVQPVTEAEWATVLGMASA